MKTLHKKPAVGWLKDGFQFFEQQFVLNFTMDHVLGPSSRVFVASKARYLIVNCSRTPGNNQPGRKKSISSFVFWSHDIFWLGWTTFWSYRNATVHSAVSVTPCQLLNGPKKTILLGYLFPMIPPEQIKNKNHYITDTLIRQHCLSKIAKQLKFIHRLQWRQEK